MQLPSTTIQHFRIQPPGKSRGRFQQTATKWTKYRSEGSPFFAWLIPLFNYDILNCSSALCLSIHKWIEETQSVKMMISAYMWIVTKRKLGKKTKPGQYIIFFYMKTSLILQTWTKLIWNKLKKKKNSLISSLEWCKDIYQQKMRCGVLVDV